MDISDVFRHFKDPKIIQLIENQQLTDCLIKSIVLVTIKRSHLIVITRNVTVINESLQKKKGLD